MSFQVLFTWIELLVFGLLFLLLDTDQLGILKPMDSLPSTEPVNKRGRVPRAVGQAAKARTVADADIQKVFDFWVTTLRSNKSSRTRLDDKRKLFIGAAIHDYGIDDCMKAITGCSKSPFHMGANRNKKRYDSLELIFRDADHIEKFCDITEADGNLGAKGFLDE